MKVCNTCKTEKDESEFFLRDKKTGRLRCMCRDCKRVADRNFYEKSEQRREKMRVTASYASQKVREFLRRYKRLLKCSRCGDSRDYVLDFHHIRDKIYTISQLASKGVSLKTAKDEIRKCIPLCANCHRELHHLEGLN